MNSDLQGTTAPYPGAERRGFGLGSRLYVRFHVAAEVLLRERSERQLTHPSCRLQALYCARDVRQLRVGSGRERRLTHPGNDNRPHSNLKSHFQCVSAKIRATDERAIESCRAICRRLRPYSASRRTALRSIDGRRPLYLPAALAFWIPSR